MNLFICARNFGFAFAFARKFGNTTAIVKFYSTNRTKNLTLPVDRLFGPETEKQFLLRKGFKATFDNFLTFINIATEESKLYRENSYKYYQLKNAVYDLVRDKGGIYMFTNKITKKSYIGQSSDLERRLMVDYMINPSSLTTVSPFHRTLHKFGLENWSLTILESDWFFGKRELRDRENYYISVFNSQYNIRKPKKVIEDLNAKNKEKKEKNLSDRKKLTPKQRLLKKMKLLQEVERLENKKLAALTKQAERAEKKRISDLEKLKKKLEKEQEKKLKAKQLKIEHYKSLARLKRQTQLMMKIKEREKRNDGWVV